MNKKAFKEFKQSLDEMCKIQAGTLKPRRSWRINPRTRVQENGKAFSRSKEKQKFRKDIQDE